MTMASLVPSPELLGAIDSLWTKLSVRHWTAKLYFTCAPIMEAVMGCPLIPHPDPVDICAYLGGSKSKFPMVTRLYLDPLVYNKPPTSFKSIQDNAHFKLLKIALLTAASVGEHHLSAMVVGGTPVNSAVSLGTVCSVRVQARRQMPPQERTICLLYTSDAADE